MVSVEYFTVFILVVSLCPTIVATIELRADSRYHTLVDGNNSTCVGRVPGITFSFNDPVTLDTIRVLWKTKQSSTFYAYVYHQKTPTATWNLPSYYTSKEGRISIATFPPQTEVTSVKINSISKACEVQFSNKCPDGTYGQNCSSRCSPGCLSSPLCNHVTGECEYRQGYYCKEGWTHTRSNKYRCDKICQTGYYGDGCRRRCGDGCKQGNCSHVDGSCECKDGWRGRTCSEECPRRTYGHNCSSFCSPGCYSTRPCDHVTGECYYGRYGPRCRDGWTHLNDSLQRCDKKECSAGCDGECDPTNGRCDNCKPGWKHSNTSLPKCDSICPSRTYGAGCRTPCGEGCQGGTCDHVDGTCNCKAGWEGGRCDTSCSNKMYGDGCRTPCSEGCQYTCNHVNGSCSCKDGWMGHKCSTQCNAGFYGPDCSKTCNEGCVPEDCDHVDGYCDQCKDGWTGSFCENKCWREKYGPSCTQTCGRYCNSCHHVSGSCESDCIPGWYGENCTDTCPPGFYGDGCKSECHKGCKPEKCNTTNGKCGPDCREGWTGENCIEKCVPGTYGENCVFNCSEGCISPTCNRVSGRCEDCLEGWQHHDFNTSRCDKKCDEGYFGKGCNHNCSASCNNQSCYHVNGACLHGCVDERKGVFCESFAVVKSEDGDGEGKTLCETSKTIPVYVWILILILVILFFTSANIFMQRHIIWSRCRQSHISCGKKTSKPDGSETHEYDIIHIDESNPPLYENSPADDQEYETVA